MGVDRYLEGQHERMVKSQLDSIKVDKPTEPGYYWVRQWGQNYFIVEVAKDEQGLWCYVIGVNEIFNIKEFHDWYGPLKPPEP